jgi:twinfilin-like protein
MVYSSGALGAHKTAQAFLPADAVSAAGALSVLAPRKVETSEPRELDEAYLRAELGFERAEEGKDVVHKQPGEAAQGFARPKGPGRKR